MIYTPAVVSRRVLPQKILPFTRKYSAQHVNGGDTRRDLRELLRETAQSVAVVTSLMPSSASEPKSRQNSEQSDNGSKNTAFHGATLSSFTSIALDPHPLVAFSLRVPSRMAAALNAYAQSMASSNSLLSSHMVINILSASQPHVAHIFSRPDLHPRPFEDAATGVKWIPSIDGLPIIDGALGALSCSVIGRSIPLDSAFACPQSVKGDDEVEGSGLGSELFIARVLRVEKAPELTGIEEEDDMRTLPLLYHRRRYGTIQDLSRQ
ncbi:flavin reductase like domain-containing protein [Hygrophoropsis aurantiaca]|uniref:Flavin reductase like domain-containing protein n=1 Tax=Hygrophoropsis aurantiaca TaxID=72124 RepID=A0ACB8A689_9AGAM|nr:flavin reductase like domain-containing protein [Hygrophoropsis aurantiaca]